MSSKWFQGVRCVVAALLTIGASESRADTRPIVHVEARLEQIHFWIHFGEDKGRRLESELSKELVHVFNRKVSFLRFTTDASGAPHYRVVLLVGEKKRLVIGHVFIGNDGFPNFHFHHSVHQQERIALREVFLNFFDI